jgi:DNA-directed RNA polymerase subunit RPC12/RpoP
MPKKKTYGCIKCGKPFEVYPPDDFHQDASRDPKELEEDFIKIDYECKNLKCHTINTLYWGSQKTAVAAF